MNSFSNYIGVLTDTANKIDIKALEACVDIMIDAYKKGGTIYIFGNGGSGATASHVSGDFIKGVSLGLSRKFKVVFLNDNVSAMLAISNDLSYDDIFVEQLRGRLNNEDVVIGISGSGNSINVVKALEYSIEQKVKTVAFCGYKGGKIKDMADSVVHIPVMDMEITEDLHLVAFHAIKQEIIIRLAGNMKVSMGEQYDKRIK
ncbi:MAG: SIS domain-containing protein [Bacteroidota bacterium]|nr:SIS domain-containing protein [Bacteroidota bacterium]